MSKLGKLIAAMKDEPKPPVTPKPQIVAPKPPPPPRKHLTQWQFPAGKHVVQTNIETDGEITKEDITAIIETMAIIREQMPPRPAPIPADWVPCENCNGTGLDGWDRCDPPGQYDCDECDGKGKVPPVNATSEGSPPSRLENKQERNGDSLH